VIYGVAGGDVGGGLYSIFLLDHVVWYGVFVLCGSVVRQRGLGVDPVVCAVGGGRLAWPFVLWWIATCGW